MPEGSIDWQAVGEALGLQDGDSSSERAQRALAHVLGEGEIRHAVDWYLARRPHAELVRQVLWQLRPAAARDHLMEIYRTDANPQRRRDAVMLLKVVVTGEDLPLVEEFMRDSDPVVNRWGVGVLDHLLWSNLVDEEEAERYLHLAETSEDDAVTGMAANIREHLRER